MNKDAVAQAKVKFKKKDLKDAERLLTCDLWDTYLHIINNKWNEKMKIDKETYVENTNIAIATLHMYADGAIECIKTYKAWRPAKIKRIREKMNLMKGISLEDV